MTSGLKPKISVVIPNRNGSSTLRETLESVFATGDEHLEVIVADDASTDDSPDIAEELPVRLLRHDTCRGAAQTRNTGAAEASGEIIVFIDNDIIIPPDTFERLRERFLNPEVSGVIGLLRPVTRYFNLSSQYKNFYMHYTYMRLPEDVTVFYTSIAAIRKNVFEECGGFNIAYRSATIEDMEFGVRVTGRGHRIFIDRGLQVEHIRYYSLGSLLKTGFWRSAGLTKLALRDRLKRKEKRSYVTTSPSFLIGIILSHLTLVSLILALVLESWPWLIPAAGAYLAVIGLNFGFLRSLAHHTKPSYFWLACGLIYIDLLAHGLGNIWGVLSFLGGVRY